MTRRNPPAKWVLPDVINPPGRTCYQISVPDNIYHKAAFFGALLDLASAYKWADDPSHTAKSVALVWRDIIDNLRLCPDPVKIGGADIEDNGMRLRVDPDNSCIIQCLDECSGNWGTFLDVSQCAPGAIAQPPAGGTLEPGDSKCYDVVLQGSGKWLLPVAVSEGDKIIISGAAGGWFDGAFVIWNCPNGQQYVAGACSGVGTTEGTDPCPAILHMRLIALVGADCFDAYNTTITVGAGVTDADVQLQANDSTLNDNAGSINFRVCVERAATPGTWSHTYDLTVNNGGFTNFFLGFSRAAYYAGFGWSVEPAVPGYMQLNSPVLPASAHITHMEYWYNTAVPGGTTADVEYPTYTGTNFAVDNTPSNPLDFVGDMVTDRWWTNVDSNGGSLSGIYLYKVVISGVGPDPY